MKTTRALAVLCGVGGLAFAASVSNAAIIVYTTTMNGANEAPPNGSPGTGSATLTFDTTLNKPIWRNAANTGWVDATGAGV